MTDPNSKTKFWEESCVIPLQLNSDPLSVHLALRYENWLRRIRESNFEVVGWIEIRVDPEGRIIGFKSEIRKKSDD